MKSYGEVVAGAYPPAQAPVSLVERCIAFAAIAVLSPVLLLLGLAVSVVSGRSPLVAHRRAGYLGRPLWMVKFRTMWDGTPGRRKLVERLEGPYVPGDKSIPDVRITHPLGRWMRRCSLDELPQLIHVATGEMSFVGPRPITEGELACHYGAVAAEVLSRKPGITGLWQVMGRSGLTYHQRRRLDLFLVRKNSRKLTIWIAARTIPVVITGDNAR